MNPRHTPSAKEAALITPQQCADLLNVSRRTITNWSKARTIPSIRLGRVRRYDLAKVKAALERFEQIEITR